MNELRPATDTISTGAELRRWYWLKTELVLIARRLGVPAGGSKIELTARLVAALDGAAPPEQPPRQRGHSQQLTGPLSLDTVLPPGQRSSQRLREFFTEHIGPGFRFDGPMRAFIAAGSGATLAEAIEHWHLTRGQTREIEPQFELNKFIRAWHLFHPEGSRAEALDAWRLHRALPIEARATVS